MIDLHITSGIYCLINKVNLKMYIGQSRNIESRVYGHIAQLINGLHPTAALQADWDRLGADAFEAQVLVVETSKAQREKIEEIFIHAYQALDPSFGYNLPKGRTRQQPI
jgi:group I intron endonuclease